MIDHNHTPWSVETIQTFPYLGRTVNRWRGRVIFLFAHPSDADSLVSIGEGLQIGDFLRVIAIEARTAYATALDYIAHGKVYVSQ